MARASVTSTAPVVLVCGDDEFAVKERARELYNEWCQELGGMDHEVIDAQVTNSGEALKALARLREALQTLPFFGSGKAVWLQNCSFLGEERTASAQAVTESLADLSQELKAFNWQNVRLLITSGKVDKRKTFYKTLEKIGRVEAFNALSVDDRDWASAAETWAARAVRARKKEITDEALAELVNSLGPNHRQQSEASGATKAGQRHRGARRAIWEPADHFAGGTRPARPHHDLAGAAAARRGGDGAGNRRYPGCRAYLRA